MKFEIAQDASSLKWFFFTDGLMDCKHWFNTEKEAVTCAAAAPEMKAALEKMFQLFVNNCSMRGNTLVLDFNPAMDIEKIYDDYCKRMGAALAKAEGKSCNGDCLDCEELNSPNCKEGK